MKNKWKNVKIIQKIYIDNAYGNDNIEDQLFEENRLVIGEKKSDSIGITLYIDILVHLILPYPELDFNIYTTEIDRDTNSFVQNNYLFSDFGIFTIVFLTKLI